MRFVNRDFYRFVFWGAINTLVGYALYLFLLLLLPYLIAYSVAYVFGVFFSYYLNSKFVFKQQLKLSKALKYPLVYVTQYILGAVSLYLMVQRLKINKVLAPTLVVLLTIPITYLLSKTIVSGRTDN
ncbi:MAG: GtrA family protein [Pyrinomonadaceae bacterium]